MSAITLPAPTDLSGTPPRRHTRVGRRLALVAMVLGVVLLATSCTGRAPTPTGYGDPGSSVEKHFLEGCVAPEGEDSKASNPDDLCKCFYAKIKAKIPFEEFKKVNSELSENPAPLPANFLALLDQCKAAQ